LGEEIDLRGLNVDEALARLDGFLDHHYQGTTQHVRIIHGHGTGVLREAIRAQLKRSGYVSDFQREEEKQGGNGATLVTLSGE
jgi:DNA mismatch repair protein MutS2